MELKLRKYINNVRMLPKYENEDKNGSPDTKSIVKSRYAGADYGNTISSTLGAASSIYDAHLFDTSADEYLNKYGYVNASIGDIGYTKYNDINKGAEMDIVSAQNTKNTLTTVGAGAAAGGAIGTAIVPGIGSLIGAGIGALGGLIGGLFGSSSRKRKAREALQQAQWKVDNYNDFGRSSALTASLQQKQAQEYGDTRTQTLYAYDVGKDFIDPVTRSTINDHIVETSDGTKIDKQNSWVSEGEGVWNPETGGANYITHGPNDTARANLSAADVVFGKKINPTTGNSFKDDAAPYIIAKEKLNKMRPKSKGWLSDQTQKTWDAASKPLAQLLDMALSNLAEIQRSVPGKYSNLKSLPGFDNSKDYGLDWWSNGVPSIFGGLAAINQYFDAKNDDPYYPDTFVANPYQTKGLNILAGLRTNTYPIVQKLREAEQRQNYAINASGGLSTAQKHLSRLSALNSTQLNIANLLAAAQDQDNKYQAQYANAALQYGEAEAKLRQQARQYDIDYFSKAHAAKQQGKQMGIYNFLNSLNQYSANEFKRKNAIANLDMYKQSLNLERQRIASGVGDYTVDLNLVPFEPVSIPKPSVPKMQYRTPSVPKTQDPDTRKQRELNPNPWIAPRYKWHPEYK